MFILPKIIYDNAPVINGNYLVFPLNTTVTLCFIGTGFSIDVKDTNNCNSIIRIDQVDLFNNHLDKIELKDLAEKRHVIKIKLLEYVQIEQYSLKLYGSNPRIIIPYG